MHLEKGSWRLPLQRRGDYDEVVFLSGLPNELCDEQAKIWFRRAPFNGEGSMEPVHWAPKDHRFRPYQWRVVIDDATRARLGVWVSPENPPPTFLPWLHEQIGRSAATWMARLIYCRGFRGGMKWYIYFVRYDHAVLFLRRWGY